MRKQDFCLGENKGADQLRSYFAAPLFSLHGYYNSSTVYYQNFTILALFYADCTGRFVSDLVGNPEDRFSCVAAHFLSDCQFLGSIVALNIELTSLIEKRGAHLSSTGTLVF